MVAVLSVALVVDAFCQNLTKHNPAPSPSGHPLLSGPPPETNPEIRDIHLIFTRRLARWRGERECADQDVSQAARGIKVKYILSLASCLIQFYGLAPCPACTKSRERRPTAGCQRPSAKTNSKTCNFFATDSESSH